ncbi:hypothetical protein BGAPBR_K0040 (plasmid) [Borreliella garinii PBr]|uniref:Uncharacterized protein n=1 Tax=Borreliella garinii PBr TaxID=498743 RepID=B8F0S3_BORGR|nr:hypothetical protein BGAPBR_K0040 [Borreliella garinii PBr]
MLLAIYSIISTKIGFFIYYSFRSVWVFKFFYFSFLSF